MPQRDFVTFAGFFDSLSETEFATPPGRRDIAMSR
jgi:hypothetical protein